MRRARGFTLTELTLVIALSSILILGLTASMHMQVKSTVEMRDQLIALNLARQKMAVVRAGAYPNTGTTDLSPDPSFPDFAIQQVVTNIDTASGRSLRQVEISVFKGSTVLAKLATRLSNLIQFGDGL